MCAHACVCQSACACVYVQVALLFQHATRMRHIVMYLWPVRLLHIFRHYLINGTVFGKKLLNIKCVFWFSLHLSSETFLILSHKCGNVFM